MVELELVGLSEDGTQVVFADAEGDEFSVPVDDRLRAAVRRARVPSGQWEISMESALRPRDIQARIRAGENPEAVAEIAQVPVEKIMGYAVPVMAERQHIAERAQRSAVRRKNADGPGQLLGDAVAERLRARDVDPDTCQWDAWRREDGRWTVAARYRGTQGERMGMFVFDALSRYTLAEDDEARTLVGERVAEPEPKRRRGGRRLSAVSSEYDAMLFDDEEPTTDLTAVADLLGEQQAAPSAPPAGQEPAREEPAAERTGPVGDAPAAESGRDARPGGEEPSPRGPAAQEQPAARTASGEEAQPHERTKPSKQQPKPEKRGRRGRGRASVPSWDEIMFGQPKG